MKWVEHHHSLNYFDFKFPIFYLQYRKQYCPSGKSPFFAGIFVFYSHVGKVKVEYNFVSHDCDMIFRFLTSI